MSKKLFCPTCGYLLETYQKDGETRLECAMCDLDLTMREYRQITDVDFYLEDEEMPEPDATAPVPFPKDENKQESYIL